MIGHDPWPGDLWVPRFDLHLQLSPARSSSLSRPLNHKIISRSVTSDGASFPEQRVAFAPLPLVGDLQQFYRAVGIPSSTRLSDCGANPEPHGVAKDRSWFGNVYTPFNTVVTDMLGNSIPIVGVGSVNLPVETSPSQTGPNLHRFLRLKTVLHAYSSLQHYWRTRRAFNPVQLQRTRNIGWYI